MAKSNTYTTRPVQSVTVGTPCTGAGVLREVAQAVNYAAWNNNWQVLNAGAPDEFWFPFEADGDSKVSGLIYVSTLTTEHTVAVWARSTTGTGNIKFRVGSMSYTTIPVTTTSTITTFQLNSSAMIGGTWGSDTVTFDLEDDTFGINKGNVYLMLLAVTATPNALGTGTPDPED